MISGSYFSQLDVKETTDDAVEIGETKIGSSWIMSLKYYKPAERYLFTSSFFSLDLSANILT